MNRIFFFKSQAFLNHLSFKHSLINADTLWNIRLYWIWGIQRPLWYHISHMTNAAKLDCKNDTCLTCNAHMVLFHRGAGAEPLLPWNRMLQTQNAGFQPNQYQMLAGPGGYPPRRDDRGGRQVIWRGLWDEKHTVYLAMPLRAPYFL